MVRQLATLALLVALSPAAQPARATLLWTEGEAATQSTMHRHPWWYDKVRRDQLSGGDFITNFDKDKPGEAEYAVTAPAAGKFVLWVRANPVQAKLSYQLNGAAWVAIDFAEGKLTDRQNIAEDGKPDLRFLAWVDAGPVALKAGANVIRFRMDSENSNHGMLDCFVLTDEPFTPHGADKPGAVPAAAAAAALPADGGHWLPFAPKPESFGPTSGFDLRSLNEPLAGDGGFIEAKGGHFVHSRTGAPLRFWAVNGPPNDLKDPAGLRAAARLLAKYGVNMVRLHGGYYDKDGTFDPARVRHAQDVVDAMKQEGIYTHLSVYFPLWLDPKPDNAFLPGYDGKAHPFAALYFNPEFQARYRSWWKAILQTPGPRDNRPLVDEPALASVEIINEDSYFFWTFNDKNIPDAELRILEHQFGDWAKEKYGSAADALKAWGGKPMPRDNAAEGRLAFRPLFNLFGEKKPRDQDTARFLLASQRSFYARTVAYLRELGFKGVITCSNWTTASPEVLGPLEEYSYTAGDFIDRHGYFSCDHHGDAAEWSVRNGHTYADRSALRFDPEQPGKPKVFAHPAMDTHYDGKPSMISEIAWNRPNRFRGEAPLFLAAYGALQDSDSIVHFAMDGAAWSVKPGYFMQPWTLLSPATAGQFPAAAMIYRAGLVKEGATLVDLKLKLSDLLSLKGTPMPQGANLDELRMKDVPTGTVLKPGNVIDPLVHFAGRTNVSFVDGDAASTLVDLAPYVDHAKQTVISSTRQLKLDYAAGLLTIDAPAAQGASGALAHGGQPIELADLSVRSDLETGHVIAVSLDGKPLASSGRLLLQAMSEEQPTGFKTEPAPGGLKRIISIGTDPWLVREIAGTVRFKRADAGQLNVTLLDANGYPAGDAGTAAEIRLRPGTLYYLITR